MQTVSLPDEVIESAKRVSGEPRAAGALRKAVEIAESVQRKALPEVNRKLAQATAEFRAQVPARMRRMSRADVRKLVKSVRSAGTD